MVQFYLIINREQLYVFRRVKDCFETENFKGEPCFTYAVNRVKEATDALMRTLIDNYNLEDESGLSFFVLSNGDKALDSAFRKALGLRIAQEIKIEDLLERAINMLSLDSTHLINKFGVNYDDHSYRIIENKLCSSRFSLLSYTLNPVDLINILTNIPGEEC